MNPLRLAILAAFITLSIPLHAIADPDRLISNDRFDISCNAATGVFTVAVRGNPKPFGVDLKLLGAGGTTRIAAETDPVFGNSALLEITHANGNRSRITIFD